MGALIFTDSGFDHEESGFFHGIVDDVSWENRPQISLEGISMGSF